MPHLALRLFVLCGLLAGLHAESVRSLFAEAVTEADFDFAHCRSYTRGEPAEPEWERFRDVIGLGPHARNWHPARQAFNDGKVTQFDYVVALKREVEVGSLLLVGQFQEIFVLQPGAPYPPDPARAEHWQPIPFTPRRAGDYLLPLPPGTKTRALLLRDRRDRGRGIVNRIRFLQRRLYSVTPEALAFADREYTRISKGAPRSTYAASRVTRGTGSWQNVGPDTEGQIQAPPVSEPFPSWFMLTWPQPQALAGLLVRGNQQQVALHRFDGPDDVNPRVGTEREWRHVRGLSTSYQGATHWIAFEEPLSTRGLRLTITEVSGPDDRIAEIAGLHAIIDLGQAPVPERTVREVVTEHAPVQVAFTLPWDGSATVAIEGPDGRRVRNLLARQPFTAGQHQVDWDLTDDQGVAVKPGKYTAKVLAHPPLDLRYQFTVYPNVSQLVPENAPWQTGRHGGGGWLADHSPPSSLALHGEHLYIGARVAESGVTILQADLRGAKRWGHHSLHEGFGGPWFLAADERRVYIGARATMLWTFDHETHERHDLLDRPASARRQDELKGMAARNGKLVLAQGPQAWLTNAFGADDVDLPNCVPRLAQAKPPAFAHDVPADPRTDFLRLLRLLEPPPGHRNEIGLAWLRATSGKGSRQFIMTTFRRPVPIGSIVVPNLLPANVKLTFHLMREDAPYPPNPLVAEHWQPFAATAEAPWDVVPAPPAARTRALLVQFDRADADIFDQLGDPALFDQGAQLEGMGQDQVDTADLGGRQDEFTARLEGLQVLRRRYRNVAPEAQVLVSSGTVDQEGVWRAERKHAISRERPGLYALVWPEPRKLHGLAIKEVDGRDVTVEVWDGEGAPQLRAEQGWRALHAFRQPLREYYWPDENENARARYLDTKVSFGGEVETRGVRLRITSQYVRQEWHRGRGFREDLGATDWDARRCGVRGVAALSHLGGEAPVDPLMYQRLEVLDGETAEVLHEVPIRNPGQIHYGPDGTLYGFTGGQLARLDLAAGRHQVLITDLIEPTAFCVGPEGRFWVFDNAAERQNIRVYAPDGTFERAFGRTGGREVPGEWRHDTFVNVSAMGIDRERKLWVVEHNYWPKRVSVWRLDGTFVKHFLGPTAYGGGGMLDPWDKRRFFYGPLEFELDWQAGRSKLVRLTHAGPHLQAPQRVVRHQGETYLTSHTGWNPLGAVGVVYHQRAPGQYRPVAAFGRADEWPPLNSPETLDALERGTVQGERFRWTDRNADGEVQLAEVELTPLETPKEPGFGVFNRRLTSIAAPLHYEVSEVLPNSVPVFQARSRPELPAQFLWQLDNGLYHRLHSYWRREGGETWFNNDGETVYTYPSEPNSGFAFPQAEPYRLDQVVAHFKWVGHETVPEGDLGEFVVLNSNTARWHLFTADGLLAGQLFKDLRNPEAIPWSMDEHHRGLQLRDVNIGQEHFEGYFTRTFEDDKLYAVAGHNHASLVEVNGLEKFRRWRQHIDVDLPKLIATADWRRRVEREANVRRAPVLHCYPLVDRPRLDGNPDEWKEPTAELRDGRIRFYLGLGEDHLRACWHVEGHGPMKNTGEDWRLLFKSGAAVDLLIGADPDAPEDRRAPVAGDRRLLLTLANGQPRAVLYEPVAPGAGDEAAWTATSPVRSLDFDLVRQAPEVQLRVRSGARHYQLEAVIPYRTLGLEPRAHLRLRCDWGILRTGPDGYECLERIYWANRAARHTADIPSEAQLSPAMWGHVLFHTNAAPGAPVVPTTKLIDDGPTDAGVQDLLEDLEEDL